MLFVIRLLIFYFLYEKSRFLPCSYECLQNTAIWYYDRIFALLYAFYAFMAMRIHILYRIYITDLEIPHKAIIQCGCHLQKKAFNHNLVKNMETLITGWIKMQYPPMEAPFSFAKVQKKNDFWAYFFWKMIKIVKYLTIPYQKNAHTNNCVCILFQL